MKLSLSNIGFENGDDDKVYAILKKHGFTGLEIAPPKFVGERPYAKNKEAALKANDIKLAYGLEISSMQSIWYGQTGNIFVDNEAALLKEYTRQAILFAHEINCKSLVFGCPKNRNMPSNTNEQQAVEFFTDISAFAFEKATAIALEANVAEYGTNFINTSKQAFSFARQIPHMRVNFDFGTAIANDESLTALEDNLDIVSHVHISEPNLLPIEQREKHKYLSDLLKHNGYSHFVSIEMKAQPLLELERIVSYVAEVFG